MVEKDQQDPHCPWFLTGVTAPLVVQSIDSGRDDDPQGETFGPLEAPIKHYVQAQCKDGILFASDLTGTRFQGFAGSNGNYHGLDFALFYMDIRENAILKVNTYLEAFD